MQIPGGSICVASFMCTVLFFVSQPVFAEGLSRDVSSDSVETPRIDDSVSVMSRVLQQCERVLPVCQPAVAHPATRRLAEQ